MDSILEIFRQHEKFFLVTHERPDGDAVGSMLGLGRFLEKWGKQVYMLNNDPPPRPLEWLPGVDDIAIYEEGSFEQQKALAESEVVVVLDVNSAERLGAVGKSIKRTGGIKLLIDHHTEPEKWFDATYQRDTSAATGELLYEIMAELNPDLIDEQIATALYTAIMTDTGSFRYTSVTPHIHRIIADLLERGGIEPAPIHSALYDNRTLASIRLLSKALDGIRLRYDGQVGYTVVSNDMLRSVDADSDDKKGIVSYVLSIEGVRAALIFSEGGGGTKISFRSEADTHVDEWARHFNGGGHRNASGAYVDKPLDEAVDEVLDAAPQFIDLEPESSNGTDTLTEEDASYLESMLKQKSN